MTAQTVKTIVSNHASWVSVCATAVAFGLVARKLDNFTNHRKIYLFDG